MTEAFMDWGEIIKLLIAMIGGIGLGPVLLYWMQRRAIAHKGQAEARLLDSQSDELDQKIRVRLIEELVSRDMMLVTIREQLNKLQVENLDLIKTNYEWEKRIIDMERRQNETDARLQLCEEYRERVEAAARALEGHSKE